MRNISKVMGKISMVDIIKTIRERHSVLLHESAEHPGVYICDHVPLVPDNMVKPGGEILCRDCSNQVGRGAKLRHADGTPSPYDLAIETRLAAVQGEKL